MITFYYSAGSQNFLFVFFLAFIFCLSTANASFSQGDSEEISTDEAIVSEGATLYRENCAACHAINEKLIGPALVNVYDRRPLPWLINFIQNSQKVIESGDEYAVNLYQEYNRAVMPSFDYFSEDEIISILAYIKNETESEVAEPAASTTTTSAKTASEVEGADQDTTDYMPLIFGGFFVIFILVLIVMILIIIVMKKFIEEARGEANKTKDKEYIR